MALLARLLARLLHFEEAVQHNDDMQTEGEHIDVEASLAPRPEMVSCVYCMDDLNKDKAVHLHSCAHYAYHDCTRSLFSNFPNPARCCQEVPVTATIRDVLGRQTAAAYLAIHSERARENAGDMRCGHDACRAWIPSHKIIGELATCPACSASMCRHCRKEPHGNGERCPVEVELQTLAKSNGWVQCSKCRVLVEKIDGCNHMICMCGTEFCYKCGELDPGCACERPFRAMPPADHGPRDWMGEVPRGFMAREHGRDVMTLVDPDEGRQRLELQRALMAPEHQGEPISLEPRR
ncbi:Uu.00g015350.m01.CDS01 [Anthostomella pinea]|uniref:Uu.00g015350.m01.CDS01 n=1 Tax=Anthostomella pinea TaxID=933095 RepID=A0AAI8YQH8_9PEZI|nr:Uu.00g015350.m01.CDS01 [Anthostomella pinea]